MNNTETELTLTANLLADAYNKHASDDELRGTIALMRRNMEHADDISGPVFLARLEVRLQQREAVKNICEGIASRLRTHLSNS